MTTEKQNLFTHFPPDDLLARPKASLPGLEPISPNEIGDTPSDDRRLMPRHQCAMALVMIPILSNYMPGDLRFAEATSIDISVTGLGFIVNTDKPISSELLVIGANSNGGNRAFVTVRVESQRQIAEGRYRVGGSWRVGTADDLLAPGKLTPILEPSTLLFKLGWPDNLLNAWAALGVMKRYLLDRVLVCGECSSVPSWRHGCHLCGSGRIHREQDVVECFDCGSRGDQSVMAAMCHICMKRFDACDANELGLFAYHVDRLDLLSMTSKNRARANQNLILETAGSNRSYSS